MFQVSRISKSQNVKPRNGHAIIRTKVKCAQTLDVHAFDIYVTNKSDWTITHVKVNNGPPLQLVPPIKRNCPVNETCQWAKDNGAYDPCLSGQCTDPAFTLILVVENATQRGETDPVSITPDCNFAGQLICFCEDANC
jgi:hypothetical protein